MKWFFVSVTLLLPVSTMETTFDRDGMKERYIIQREREREERFAILLDGVLFQESRHGLRVTSPESIKEDAVGVLQIRRVMVHYLNASGGDFTLSCRLDSLASIMMFRMYQERFNPSFELELGCHIWNAGPNRVRERWGLTEGYRRSVKKYLENRAN